MPAPTSDHDTRDVRSIPTVVADTRGYRYIGDTVDNLRVYIEIKLRHVPAKMTTTGEIVKRETVDHRIVTAYQELSICGELWDWSRDAGGGQCIDTLDLMDPDKLTITPDDLHQLHELWKSSHLNGLNAACIHQDHAAHIDPDTGRWRNDWEQMQDEQTAKCPNGYRYGSKWLIRALTNEELRIAHRLIDTLTRKPVSQ